ncbi:MAG: class I SAM-dependent methyltransferase [Candidatus Micrarchaeaceae archaeon]
MILSNWKRKLHKSKNRFLKSILTWYKARSILDLTAGTGAQALFLAKYFDVTANDINKAVLNIAKRKAKAQHISIKFSLGNMRGAKFNDSASPSIVIVAKKVSSG